MVMHSKGQNHTVKAMLCSGSGGGETTIKAHYVAKAEEAAPPAVAENKWDATAPQSKTILVSESPLGAADPAAQNNFMDDDGAAGEFFEAISVSGSLEVADQRHSASVASPQDVIIPVTATADRDADNGFIEDNASAAQFFEAISLAGTVEVTDYCHFAQDEGNMDWGEMDVIPVAAMADLEVHNYFLEETAVSAQFFEAVSLSGTVEIEDYRHFAQNGRHSDGAAATPVLASDTDEAEKVTQHLQEQLSQTVEELTKEREEVRALQTALSQSEAVFVEVEAQLRTALEEQARLELALAAAEESLQRAQTAAGDAEAVQGTLQQQLITQHEKTASLEAQLTASAAPVQVVLMCQEPPREGAPLYEPPTAAELNCVAAGADAEGRKEREWAAQPPVVLQLIVQAGPEPFSDTAAIVMKEGTPVDTDAASLGLEHMQRGNGGGSGSEEASDDLPGLTAIEMLPGSEADGSASSVEVASWHGAAPGVETDVAADTRPVLLAGAPDTLLLHASESSEQAVMVNKGGQMVASDEPPLPVVVAEDSLATALATEEPATLPEDLVIVDSADRLFNAGGSEDPLSEPQQAPEAFAVLCCEVFEPRSGRDRPDIARITENPLFTAGPSRVTDDAPPPVALAPDVPVDIPSGAAASSEAIAFNHGMKQVPVGDATLPEQADSQAERTVEARKVTISADEITEKQRMMRPLLADALLSEEADSQGEYTMLAPEITASSDALEPLEPAAPAEDSRAAEAAAEEAGSDHEKTLRGRHARSMARKIRESWASLQQEQAAESSLQQHDAGAETNRERRVSSVHGGKPWSPPSIKDAMAFSRCGKAVTEHPTCIICEPVALKIHAPQPCFISILNTYTYGYLHSDSRAPCRRHTDDGEIEDITDVIYANWGTVTDGQDKSGQPPRPPCPLH